MARHKQASERRVAFTIPNIYEDTLLQTKTTPPRQEMLLGCREDTDTQSLSGSLASDLSSAGALYWNPGRERSVEEASRHSSRGGKVLYKNKDDIVPRPARVKALVWPCRDWSCLCWCCFCWCWPPVYREARAWRGGALVVPDTWV